MLLKEIEFPTPAPIEVDERIQSGEDLFRIANQYSAQVSAVEKPVIITDRDYVQAGAKEVRTGTQVEIRLQEGIWTVIHSLDTNRRRSPDFPELPGTKLQKPGDHFSLFVGDATGQRHVLKKAYVLVQA